MFKIIVSDPEEGKSWQIEREATPLIGTKLGGEFNGSLIGLDGYTLEVRGGSDKEGFPMRKSVEGSGRREVLMKGGSGYRPRENGEKKRKTVRGNTVSEEIVQVNTKVVEKEGDAEAIPNLLGLETGGESAGEEEEVETETEENGKEDQG